jgi:hypothetical protein
MYVHVHVIERIEILLKLRDIRNKQFYYFSSFYFKPNVATEWLAFLFRVRYVMGSNLGPDTVYSNCGVSLFSYVPSG